jgi:hypothetical protein
MTVQDLIDRLSEYDGFAPVRLVVQPGYPLLAKLQGVVSASEAGIDDNEGTVYLASGSEIGYAPARSTRLSDDRQGQAPDRVPVMRHHLWSHCKAHGSPARALPPMHPKGERMDVPDLRQHRPAPPIPMPGNSVMRSLYEILSAASTGRAAVKGPASLGRNIVRRSAHKRLARALRKIGF